MEPPCHISLTPPAMSCIIDAINIDPRNNALPDNPQRPRDYRPPYWVKSIGGYVWITDSQDRICYMNDRAEGLFGRSAEDCVGSACWEIVAACDEQGNPFCGPNCPIKTHGQVDGELGPFHVSTTSASGAEHWLRVIVIVLQSQRDKKRFVVHCGVDGTREQRIKRYVAQAGGGTAPEFESKAPIGDEQLTRREQEVLALLAVGLNAKDVSARLAISTKTARNHIQNLCAKLSVRSIAEAVAVYLLSQEE